MKPYTLEWWIEQFEACSGRMLAYYQIRNEEKEQRCVELFWWIKYRIIKKYGEK